MEFTPVYILPSLKCLLLILEETSKREAEHCEAKEKMKIELQKKWQEMYKEWMRTTEAKIIELQAANDMLKRMLGNPPP